MAMTWLSTRTLVLLLSLATGGCTTLVTYAPQPSGPAQTLKYTQGVGTLSVKDEDQEIFVYPAFKTQGPTQPSFIVGYANNTSVAENFSSDSVKAYFRGQPVSIYTYTEKIEEIRNEKLGQQVALAIVGGAAAVAAARNASNQTYTSNYSGSVWGRGGRTNFAGTSTLRVYDPAAGMLAGAAVGGATGLGIAQLEFNARNQEQAAEAILQANTVDPQRLVTGVVILKNCCDKYPGPNDDIRLDVTANGKTSSFQFRRQIGSGGGASPPTAVANVQPASAPTAVRPSIAPQPPTPFAAPVPVTGAKAVPAMATAVPTASSQGQPVTPSGGTEDYQVQQLAKSQTCSANPQPKLTAKGPGFETYVVTCSNGDVINYRCEFGSCRALK